MTTVRKVKAVCKNCGSDCTYWGASPSGGSYYLYKETCSNACRQKRYRMDKMKNRR